VTAFLIKGDPPTYFIHIPRTGGTSFCKLFDIAPLSKKMETRRNPHPTAAQVLEKIQKGDLPVGEMFGVVRNPYDRAVSQFYYDKGNCGMRGANKGAGTHVDQFEKWIANGGKKYLALKGYQVEQLICDPKTGELLAEPVLFGDFLARYPKLPHEHRSDRQHSTAEFFHSPKSRAIVKATAGWEINRYGFTHDH
jgi:hypothetical protein